MELEDFDMLGRLTLDTADFINNLTGKIRSFIRPGEGLLYNGGYQYSYRLVWNNGAKSNWCPPTNMVYLTNRTNKTTGSAEDMNSSDAILINIVQLTDLNNKIYQCKLEIARIYYNNIHNSPTVTLIYSNVVTTRYVEYTDYTQESNLGYVDINEFTKVDNMYKVKTLSVKDNILFIGNLEEDTFDVDYDARIYRFKNFNGNNLVRIMNNDGTVFTINGDSNWITSITGLNIKSHEDLNFEGKYNHNLTKLGGEGINVSLEFEGSTGVNTYMFGDVYRFGVVFIDKYGRRSPVKYIGDIKFPEEDEFVTTYKTCITPKFTVNNIPNIDGMSYIIVQAKREKKDRLIRTQGILTGLGRNMEDDIASTTFLSNNGSITNTDSLVRLISPEVVFFDSDDYTSLKVKCISLMGITDSIIGHMESDTITPLAIFTSLNNNNNHFTAYSPEVLNSSLIKQRESIYIDGVTVINDNIDSVNGNLICSDIGKSTLLAVSGKVVDGNLNLSGGSIAKVNLISNVKPYGGNGYSSRLNTVYYKAMADTYYNKFIFHHSRWHYEPYEDVDKIKGVNVVSMNVYSSIDLRKRVDDYYGAILDNIDKLQITEMGLSLVEEYPEFEATILDRTFKTREVDFSPSYLYNSVYSRQTSIIQGIEVPLDLIKQCLII